MVIDGIVQSRYSFFGKFKTSRVAEGCNGLLLTWESEALHAVEKYREDGLVVVYPSMSILAEPVVAVMDGTAEERGTSELAKKYLDELFSPSGQDAAARHYLRPRDPEVAVKYAHQFQPMELVTIDEVFGGWDEAFEKHFSRGGVFDGEAYLKRSFGIWISPVDEKLQIVRVELKGYAAALAYERRWHPTQEVRALNAKRSRVEVCFAVGRLEELVRWVLSWGRLAKVIEPRELRQMVADEVKAMGKG